MSTTKRHVVSVTRKMALVGAAIIDRHDPTFESSSEVAKQVFLEMLEARRDLKRGRGSVPKKADAKARD